MNGITPKGSSAKIDELDFETDPSIAAMRRSNTLAQKSFTPSSPVVDLLGMPLNKSALDANGLIPQEDFEIKCDPSLIQLAATKFEKKVIGSTLYTIQVNVGEKWNMAAETKKTLEEFRAFHQSVSKLY